MSCDATLWVQIRFAALLGSLPENLAANNLEKDKFFEAFIMVPSTLFPGYDYLSANEAAPAAGIFIPLASLPGLTAAEADPATGDGRKISYEICRALFNNFNAIAQGSRPARMSVARSTPTGVSPTSISQVYSLTYTLDVSSVDVAAE